MTRRTLMQPRHRFHRRDKNRLVRLTGMPQPAGCRLAGIAGFTLPANRLLRYRPAALYGQPRRESHLWPTGRLGRGSPMVQGKRSSSGSSSARRRGRRDRLVASETMTAAA